MPNTILLRGDPIASEGVATAAITPGMAVIPSGGNVAAAGAGATGIGVAREAEVVGGGIGDEYATGERVFYWSPRKGDQFLMWLATGGNVAAGALLQTGAGGVLAAVTDGPAVARAVEALNNTTGAPARIKVEIV